MENIQQTIPTENILDSCSRIRIYFIEKLARNAGYKVYLFPNDASVTMRKLCILIIFDIQLSLFAVKNASIIIIDAHFLLQ